MIKRILFIFIFCFCLSHPLFTFAIDYSPLAPISNSGTTYVDDKVKVDTDSKSLSTYLDNMYKLGIALCTGLAVIMIIIGGIQYVSSDAWSKKTDGKERILAALFGLLIALGSYALLNTINPDLLKTTLEMKTLSLEGIQTVVIDGVNTPVFANIQPGALTTSSSTSEVGPGALAAAQEACAKYGSNFENKDYIGVMDYSKNAGEARFSIINTKTGETTTIKASNGVGSDPSHTGMATSFSDIEGSKQSTLGAFKATSYVSPSTGKSVLLLNGLQSDNQNAANRGLEVHPSAYADQGGRSWGCIAYPPSMQSFVNDKLKNACIFNYSDVGKNGG